MLYSRPTVDSSILPLLLLLLLLLLFLLAWPRSTEAQMSTTTTSTEDQPDVPLSFRPSIAVLIGVFSIMFFLTILLVIYAKLCRSVAVVTTDPDNPQSFDTKTSGLDRAIIEALPFFRFSTLKGSKQGLECAVCLSRFEDTEILRLLPKCKHVFHITCVDRWLEIHSNCPLCRCHVDESDASLLKCFANSSRFLVRNPTSEIEADIELYVERDENSVVGNDSRRRSLRNVGHRIVIPDSVFRNRWSDLRSADLTSLGCDILGFRHGDRGVGTKHVGESGKRCMSEITSISRFVHVGKEEEEVTKAWWPIARRTAEKVASSSNSRLRRQEV